MKARKRVVLDKTTRLKAAQEALARLEARGLRIEEIALGLKSNVWTIYRWKNGAHTPSRMSLLVLEAFAKERAR